MAKEDNVAVFEDTEKLCRENGRLSEAVSTSLLNQQIILEKDTLGEIVRDCYSDEAKLVVSMKRSYEAAKAYKGTRIAVHNFASATNPGGGVKKALEHRKSACAGARRYILTWIQRMHGLNSIPHIELQRTPYTIQILSILRA